MNNIIISERFDLSNNFEQSDEMMQKIAQNLFHRLKQKGLEGLGYIGGQNWISGVSGLSGVKGRGADSYLDAAVTQFKRELFPIVNRLKELYRNSEESYEKDTYAKLAKNISLNYDKAVDFAKNKITQKESSNFNDFTKTAQFWKWRRPIEHSMGQQESKFPEMIGRRRELDRPMERPKFPARNDTQWGNVVREAKEPLSKELNEKIKEWQKDVLKPIFERFFRSVNRIMEARGQKSIQVGDPTRNRS